MPTTLWPCSKSSSIKYPAIKPAAPVTKIFILKRSSLTIEVPYIDEDFFAIDNQIGIFFVCRCDNDYVTSFNKFLSRDKSIFVNVHVGTQDFLCIYFQNLL